MDLLSSLNTEAPDEGVSQESTKTIAKPSKNSGRHSSGFATNAAADPSDIALLHMSAGIIVAALVILLIEGTLVFRGFNL